MLEDDEDEEGVGFLHPGDEISRFGNCVLIKCMSEDNAILMMELFKDISLGRTVTITKGEDDAN